MSSTVMAPASGNPPPSTLASGSDDDDWFYDSAQHLLGKDAGLHLHYITGEPQSTCYAYVARDSEKRRKISSYFLRKLLHSEQGEPWLCALMHGCRAAWWLNREHIIQRERRLDALARDILSRVSEVMKQ